MAAKPASVPGERSGRAEPRPIGEVVRPVMSKPLGKRGFAAAALATDWPAIVGPALASATLPLRVAFPRGARTGATLHLRVASVAMAVQLQHLGPLILERVNTHFGYGAVAKLAFAQGPVPHRAARRARERNESEIRAEVDTGLARAIAALPDPELRTALANLGRRLAAGWQRP